MKIAKITIKNHPGIGDLSLSFADEKGAPFNMVVLAGASGTGKTAVLDAIQRTFEGQLKGEFGIVTIDLIADQDDIARMALTPDGPKAFGGPVTNFTLRHDSTLDNWSAFSLHWLDPQSGPNGLTQFVMRQAAWRNVFRSFFSEASVNFDARPTQYITGLGVDDPTVTGARSGSGLASEITQLLVDVRAADAEDLTTWVEDNPGIAPPESVGRMRLGRFADAFQAMFPTKRFKGVRHVADGHVVEFEEFDRTTSIDRLSTGEKQIVFRAGFLLRSLAETKSSIVLVDEPELSLHPEWQERIVGYYKSLLGDGCGNHPQLILSTHSPFIVHSAAGAKVIILEKDQVSGAVREMPSPAYPGIRENEAVRAFNIDGFLSTAKKPLLILTEGESDAGLFATAWAKLRPGKPMNFELRAALGAKNINITLNDAEVFSKLGTRMLLGVFDFDSAFNQWNGVWHRASRNVQTGEADGLTKRHPTQQGWAMLLPVPRFRQSFASKALGGDSILSAEFLFRDADIPPTMIGKHQVALGHEMPYFKDTEKTNFVSVAKRLPPASFAAFEPLLARWEDVLAGRL